MTQKLTKMEIDRVDLVDAGANGRRFALFKRDDTDERGVIERIAKGVADLMRVPERLSKAMTFAQVVAGREISQALEENWWVLQDSLWNAIYAVDDDGSDLSLDAKKELVAQNLDEFKAFLLERMDDGIEKSAGPVAPRFIEAFVAKVGRDVSGAQQAQLETARDAFVAVLAEVEADSTSAKTEKRATAQEEDMTPEELAAAIAKGNEPLIARIEALEKGTKPEEPAEPVAKGEGDEGDEDGEVSLATVAQAITKLADRVEAIEKRPGQRQSADGEETVTKREAGQWAGIL